ncbi:hypothetical protein [Frigoribacterium salinisoli]
MEGGTTFVLAVVAKRREGTALKDFTRQDWIEIAGDAGFGVAKGGVRGLSIYSLTNFTMTSASLASSIARDVASSEAILVRVQVCGGARVPRKR